MTKFTWMCHDTQTNFTSRMRGEKRDLTWYRAQPRRYQVWDIREVRVVIRAAEL